MKTFLLAVVVALAGALSACSMSPAMAEDAPAPVCAFTLADVVSLLEKQHTQYVMLASEDIQGFVDEVAEPVARAQFEGVTNVVLAALNGQIVFGLEVKGCLIGPVPIPGVSTLPTKLSGRLPDGRTFA